MATTDTDLVEAKVHRMPPCDFKDFDCDPNPDRYDFKTRQGPWANGCTTHWLEHRMHAQLGLGKGQKLVIDG